MSLSLPLCCSPIPPRSTHTNHHSDVLAPSITPAQAIQASTRSGTAKFGPSAAAPAFDRGDAHMHSDKSGHLRVFCALGVSLSLICFPLYLTRERIDCRRRRGVEFSRYTCPHACSAGSGVA